MKSFYLKHLFAIAAVALSMSFASSCWAHATLQKSSPAANAVLTAAPSEVRIEFSEALEAAFSSISVSDEKGRPVATAKSTVDPADAKAMTVALPAIAAGHYQVKWTAVAVDGHRRSGSYAFSVKK